MRITLRIQDDIFLRLKHLAAQTHRTMTEIIEDSLRMTLAQQENLGRESRSSCLPLAAGACVLG